MRNAFSFILAVSLTLTLLISSVFAWELERPSLDVDIQERTESSFTDGKATVGLGAHIEKYYENDPDYPAQGNDYVKLRLSATANTRKIITYSVCPVSYSWHDNLPDSVFLDDDSGVWLWMQGYEARFYGGPRSAEYDLVWVSSNGFISFDPNGTPTNPYYSYNIPNTAQPNTFIAPFWRDLKPNEQGLITYGVVTHEHTECFAISWNNIPDTHGNPQTFQVLIERARKDNMKHWQSRIWFQYKSITLNDQTTVGIEDQQGGKGVSYNYQSLSNEMALLFDQSSNSAFVGHLKISLSESEANAKTKIERADESIRGYNVILNQSLPDEQEQYAIALQGGLTLLVSALEFGGYLCFGAGFMMDIALIAVDSARYMARQQALARLLDSDWYTYARVQGVTDPSGIFISEAVDASFNILVYWIFTDQQPSNYQHNLQVTAELTYVEYDINYNAVASTTIPTSVDLKFTSDANNSFDTAKTLGYLTYSTFSRVYLGGQDSEDFYEVNVPTQYPVYAIEVWLHIPQGADFDLYLYDQPDIDNPIDKSIQREGNLEYVSGIANSSSVSRWFIRMRKHSDGQGFYSFDVSVYPYEGGPGGCPFVSTWEGRKYLLDNNLLPGSESLSGADVTDYYMLQQKLMQREDGSYALLHSELESEHDFFDRVQLIAIDHLLSVNVAVSPSGEILTYTNPSPTVSAIDNDNRQVKDLLNSIDGIYYEGYNGSYITLNFGDELDTSKGAKLVLRADFPKKKSIHIQVQDIEGNWNTVATIIPRVYWATEIIDMSPYLPSAKGNLKIRLYFTASHKLDFAGLDTSPQATIQLHQGQLVSALHNQWGNVANLLLYRDQIYIKLMPGQQIELSFTLPQQNMEKRDFLIISEGHYFTPRGRP